MKRMMQEKLRFHMGLYMNQLISFKNKGVPVIISEAAKRVVESGEFQNCRNFVRGVMTIEE
jgi:hypothetical protein